MKIPEWLPDTHRPTRAEPVAAPPLIERVVQPLARFLEIEAASGFVLLICTMIALAIANSPWANAFHHFWHTPLGFRIGDFQLEYDLLHWINDGLMTIFFFVVGLEIKREIVFGELRDPRKAVLPIAAALGGMVAPAAIYLLLQRGQPGEPGWGIPMATDIAFVVGFLAVLGPRVPFGLKILLLTLAIVDDIGAVLVIAVAYTSDLGIWYLLLAGGGFVVVYLCNKMGVRSIPIYFLLGAGIWLAVLKSGVHPTVAGVILGLITPARSWFADASLLNVVDGVAQRLRRDQEEDERHHEQAVHLLTRTARETISPLDRLETALHPWVAFVIMPVFALANAGVALNVSAIANPVAIAVAAGLMLGKPLGIFVFSWLAVRMGLASLPAGVNWKVLLGAGCLAGIGFTMSMFIAGLALDSSLLDAGKIGTLCGSAVSAVLGSVLLILFLRPGEPVRTSPGQ